MADDFLILGSLHQNPGAGTAIFPPNQAFDDYWKLSEMQYRRKVFDYQKKKVETDALLKTMDFDKTGIRPSDNKSLTDYAHKNLYQYAFDNPTSLAPTMNDPDSLVKAHQFKENEAEANYRVARSKQVQKQYDEYKKAFIAKGDVDGLEALQKWYEEPDLTKMDDFDYVPQPDYNQKYVYEQITSGLKPEVTTGKAEFLAGGKVNNPEVTKWSDKNWALMNDRFDSGWSVDSSFGGKYKEGVTTHFQNAFNELGDAEKQKWGTAKEYGRYIQLGEQEVSRKPNVDSISYPPGSGDKETSPEFNWIIDNAIALTNPQSPIFSEEVVNKSGKVIGKSTDAFNSLVIPIGGKDAEGKARLGTVRGIYNINGKIYAITGSTQGETGGTDMRDLIPITNRYNQLVTPYINQQYGSSPTTAKAIQSATNYAKEVDKDNILGLPSQTSVGGEPKQKTYTANGKNYTRQELIDLGYTDADIKEALRLGNLK